MAEEEFSHKGLRRGSTRVGIDSIISQVDSRIVSLRITFFPFPLFPLEIEMVESGNRIHRKKLLDASTTFSALNRSRMVKRVFQLHP